MPDENHEEKPAVHVNKFHVSCTQYTVRIAFLEAIADSEAQQAFCRFVSSMTAHDAKNLAEVILQLQDEVQQKLKKAAAEVRPPQQLQ